MKRAVNIDERARQQCDLVRRQKRELEAAEASWDIRMARALAEKRSALAAIKCRHVRELVDLWVEQGRELGPWTAPVLAGEGPRAPEMPRDSGEGGGGR